MNIQLHFEGTVEEIRQAMRAFLNEGNAAPQARAPRKGKADDAAGADAGADKDAEGEPAGAAGAAAPVVTLPLSNGTAKVNGTPIDTLTVEQVRELFRVKAQAGHRPALKALLAKYGSESVTNLDPKHYRDFVAEINKLG